MVYFQIDLIIIIKPEKMDIKDKLVLKFTTWTELDEIEYNTIGAFKTRGSNKLGYYTVRMIEMPYFHHHK